MAQIHEKSLFLSLRNKITIFNKSVTFYKFAINNKKLHLNFYIYEALKNYDYKIDKKLYT